MALEFDKTTEWEKSRQLMKLYAKKDKNGKTYYIGELNRTYTVTVKQEKPYKEGDTPYLSVNLAPIKYVKKGESAPAAAPKAAETDDIFGG